MPAKGKSTIQYHERRAMRRHTADIDLGLTPAQVKEYREHGWDNRPVESTAKTTAEIIKTNVFTFFNFLFIFFAILLILVGSYKDLAFLLVIILNTLIGIVQELNAKRTLEKLNILNTPTVRVLRNGKEKNLTPDRLVLDDIVIFGPGNQICADAIVVDGEVSVNESLLTGEADEIQKAKGDPLMSGSFIVSGTCKARLERVGEDSYISRLTMEAKRSKKGEQSEMIRSINRLVKVIGIIIVPIGLLLFYQQYVLFGAGMKTSVTSMVAAVTGMVPEGLYLIASMALAASVVRLAMKKVLVHDMKCIETLARVDVLCVDKTGTITENEMSVDEVIVLDGYKEESMPPLNSLLNDFACAMSNDNSTMAALQKYFTAPPGLAAEHISSFSSQFKYSGAVFNGVSYVLGAPEFVLRSHFTDYEDQIYDYSDRGQRVLAFAQYDGTLDGKALTGSVTPLGLVLLSNPIRKDAKSTFSFFAEQGVDIKVISGDNPRTVSRVAAEAGIRDADKFIDASTFESYEELARATKEFTVFGRVTPEQKRMFVRALKEDGHTVAMTGDGVNDVLALKDADCSVAMASGSDAASSASQLVLLDSDFARMPDIVMEGRQVVNNLQRSGSLFLVKNIFSLLMSIFAITLGLTYPLEPSQITLSSLFTIGLPALLLSQIPNRELIRGKYIVNVLIKSIPAGLTNAIIIGALVIFSDTFNLDSTEVSMAAMMLLSIVGFIIVFQISRPMNKIKWGILGISILGMALGAAILPRVFSIYGMSIRCVLLFLVFTVMTEPLLRYLTRLVAYIKKRIVNYLEQRKRQDDRPA